MYSINLANGARTTVTTNLGGDSTRNINALGYNSREDYMYAISQPNTGTGDYRLIRILGNGNTTTVTTFTQASKLYNAAFNTGDIDQNGQYWISTGGIDWYQYDFLPGSATYGRLVGSGLVNGGADDYSLGDWSVVPGPGGGDLWTIGVKNFNCVLMRWSRTTKDWTIGQSLGALTGVTSGTAPFFGATYATTDGFLYAVENNSGQVWRIAVDGSSAPVQQTSVPSTSRNDGARCLDSGSI
ncbi:proline rich protein 5MeD [Colletotrichum camelliae]|nr:proline rich protein 5MeD [Colletotrichum camelliae]